MTTVTIAQTSMKTQVKPQDHLFAVYQDAIGFRAVIRWHGQTHSFDISPASGKAIMAAAMLDGAVEGSEGYDDDPTAHICWLHPNDYINKLSDDEQQAARLFQWQVANPQPRNRNPITGHYTGGDRGGH